MALTSDVSLGKALENIETTYALPEDWAGGTITIPRTGVSDGWYKQKITSKYRHEFFYSEASSNYIWLNTGSIQVLPDGTQVSSTPIIGGYVVNRDSTTNETVTNQFNVYSTGANLTSSSSTTYISTAVQVNQNFARLKYGDTNLNNYSWLTLNSEKVQLGIGSNSDYSDSPTLELTKSSIAFTKFPLTVVDATADSHAVTKKQMETAIAVAKTSSKYSTLNPALTGVDGICTWTVTHNLNDWEVIMQLRDATSNKIIVFADMTVISANAIQVNINADSVAAGTYRAVVKK